MRVQDTKSIGLELTVLTAAVTEIARVLSTSDASSVANAIATQLGRLLEEAKLPERADESLACYLVPLIAALHRGPSSKVD